MGQQNPGSEIEDDAISGAYDGGTVSGGIENAEKLNNTKKSNLKGLLSNPSTRPKILGMGFLLIVIGVGGYLTFKSGAKSLEANSVAPAPSQSNEGRADTSEHYQRLNSQVNADLAKQAENSGASYIDVSNANPAKQIELPDVEKPVESRPQPMQQQQVQMQQQVNNADQHEREEVTRLMGAMNTQAKALMDSWNYRHHANVNLTQAQNSAAGKSYASSMDTTQAEKVAVNTSAANAPAFYIKAGKIYYGVSNIDVNTDSASNEATATVLSGPLKDAMLIGAYSKGKESVVLRFTAMSAPWLDEPIKVNVLAVNPDTSTKDMATSVDHHYFERYALLIASSFISGLGQAAERAGSTVTTGINGTATAYGEVSTSQQAKIAIGKSGDAVARELSKSAPVAVTVKLDPGTPLGLLFLENVGIPAANPSNPI